MILVTLDGSNRNCRQHFCNHRPITGKLQVLTFSCSAVALTQHTYTVPDTKHTNHSTNMCYHFQTTPLLPWRHNAVFTGKTMMMVKKHFLFSPLSSRRFFIIPSNLEEGRKVWFLGCMDFVAFTTATKSCTQPRSHVFCLIMFHQTECRVNCWAI